MGRTTAEGRAAYNRLPEVAARRRARQQDPAVKAARAAYRRRRYREDSQYRARRNLDKKTRHHVRLRTDEAYRIRYNKKKQLRAKYGITVEQRDLMVSQQNHLCAICGEPKPLCVDHNHTTGAIRELLCRMCNLMLGYIEARPHLIFSCQNYLEKHK